MTLVAFGLSVLIAGMNFIAVRFSNEELPPFWGAGLRFGIASLLLFGLVGLRRLPLPRGASLVGACAYGLLSFGVSYALAYWGLREAPSGFASVVIALVPLLTFFFALLHRLESFRWRPLVGGFFAVAGILFVFRDQLQGAVPLASLLALLGAAVAIAYTNIVVKLTPKTHPAAMNAVAMATGVLLLVVASWLGGERMVLPQLVVTRLTLVYLVLVGSIVLFLLYLYVLERWTATAVAYQLVLAPLVTVPAAAWLRNEPVTLPFLVGGALVLAGVYIGVIRGGERKKGGAHHP